MRRIETQFGETHAIGLAFFEGCEILPDPQQPAPLARHARSKSECETCRGGFMARFGREHFVDCPRPQAAFQTSIGRPMSQRHERGCVRFAGTI